MRTFWKFLVSVRLAIVLILALTIGCVLATLVPQGMPEARYAELYPRAVALLVTKTGLADYFTSPLFILPALGFVVNLGACTIDRLLREVRKRGARRHGPDLLHIGILVLVVGAAIGFSGRWEGAVSLAVGDSVKLPGGEVLTLVDFRDERYPDGRPKNWISVVDVSKDDQTILDDRAIRVNDPLRVGSVAIYQSTYGETLLVNLVGSDGTARSLSEGQSVERAGVTVSFMAIEGADGTATGMTALLRVARASATADAATASGPAANADTVVRVGAEGANVGPWRASVAAVPTAGLEAVADPGFPVVAVGLALIALGTAWTFIQKLKETA